MAKKGQVFQTYTKVFKLEAVKAYVEGSSSYKVEAEEDTSLLTIEGSSAYNLR